MLFLGLVSVAQQPEKAADAKYPRTLFFFSVGVEGSGSGLKIRLHGYFESELSLVVAQAAQRHYVWARASEVIWSNLVGVY